MKEKINNLSDAKIILIQAILASLILLLTLGANYSDSKISDFNNNLFINQGTLNNFLLKDLKIEGWKNQYELFSVLATTIPNISINDIQNKITDPDQDAIDLLYNQFKAGKINQVDLFSKTAEFYKNWSNAIDDDYNVNLDHLNNQYQNGTGWTVVKNIFIFVQIFLILSSILIPFFKILDAKKNQTPLPENAAVDSEGEITTDSNKAIDETEVSNLLPMGGNYKGYNINYLMEIMTSALIGARVSSQMSNSYIETEHGGFIIAIAIDKVTDRNKYDVSIKSMNEKIRSQKLKKGIDKVEVPGDRNLEKKIAVTDDTDIEIDEEYKEILERI